MLHLDWTPEEVADTVADYLVMLRAHVAGWRYSIAQHRAALRPRLRGRSDRAIELMHESISAALAGRGYLFVGEYAPRGRNYRLSIASELDRQLALDPALARSIGVQEFPIEQAPEIYTQPPADTADGPEANATRMTNGLIEADVNALEHVLPYASSLPRNLQSRLVSLHIQDSHHLTAPAPALLLWEAAEAAWEPWEALTFGDIAPRVSRETPIAPDDLSARLYNALRRFRGSVHWKHLLDLTPHELLRIRGLGRKSAVEFLAYTIGLALESVGSPAPVAEAVPPAKLEAQAPALTEFALPVAPSVPNTRAHGYDVVEALERVAAWGAAELGTESVLGALEALLKGEDAPRAVKGFAEWLGSVDARTFGDRFIEQHSVEHALRTLEDHFDGRAWAILKGRTLVVDGPLTLEELGTSHGVTRERVRQIETKAVQRLRDEAKQVGRGVLKRMAARVRNQLGAAVRASRLSDMRTFDARDGLASQRVMVLLWLAGPYRREGDWLVLRSVPDLRRQTEEELKRVTEHGPIPRVDALAAVERIGVITSEAASWFEYVGGFKEFGGRVMPWSGSMADKAHSILALRGEPMTRDELFAMIGGTSPQSLANQLFADSRLKRTTLRHFGLAGWEHDAYTSVADEIREEIDRRGGEAVVRDLIRHVSATYHVAESSVRAYAAGPQFVRTGIGRIRNRREGESSIAKTGDPALTRGVYVRDDGWTCRLPVTIDLLRGSGIAIPNAVAAAVGVQPGESKTYVLVGAPLWVGWPSLQASVGSMRVAAMNAGASPGDEVFLTLRFDGTAEVSLLAADDVTAASGMERLALLVGVQPGEEALDRIGIAVGLPFPPSPTAAEIARRLTVRKEPEMAALLPASVDRDAPRSTGGRFLDVLLDSLQD